MADNGLSSRMIIISSLLVLQMNVPFSTGKRRTNKAHNSIIDVKTDCSLSNMNVSITMSEEFQGVVYARGFPLECRALGSHVSIVTLHLAASGCGVRITPNPNGGLLYSVVLEIQMAKHLQQVTDPMIPVSCVLSEDKMVLKSHVLNVEKPKSRSGRMIQHSGEPQPKAWLEIRGSSASQDHKSVIVGEHTTILVKTWLPENFGGQVVDCWAHDGLGETSQSLIDSSGCPVDEVLVPKLQVSPDLSQTLSGYRYTVQTTSFPAFKFPDRQSVHFRCGLQLCRGICEQVDCSSNTPRHRQQRKYKGEEGEVLDYIQLFNSVEVLAPGIEMENEHKPSHSYTYTSEEEFGELVKDAPFCLSASRMAFAFAGLGLIFLTAVAVSLYVLLRRRLLQKALADDARLVCRDSLSLIVGQNSRSSISASAWSYGRI